MVRYQFVKVKHILIGTVIRLYYMYPPLLKLLDIFVVIPFKRVQILQIITHFAVCFLISSEQSRAKLAKIADNCSRFIAVQRLQKLMARLVKALLYYIFSYTYHVGDSGHKIFCVNRGIFIIQSQHLRLLFRRHTADVCLYISR